MKQKGLQTGPDILLAVIGGIISTALAVAISVTPARAGIQDGPEPMAGVVVDDGVPFVTGEFNHAIVDDSTPFGVTLDATGQSCTSRDIDNCWSDCEDYVDGLGGNYHLTRIDCRISSGGPACSCTVAIPGPYHPPIYWPGVSPLLDY